MKSLLSISLCLLLAAQAFAQTNSPPVSGTKTNEWTVPVCLIVLTALATAGCVVIYVYSTQCSGCENKRLILESSCYDGTWTPISTNDVPGLCTNKWEIFRGKMGDSTCKYRVKVVDIPQP